MSTPKITDPSNRPVMLSLSLFLAALGWFWDQQSRMKDKIYRLENRVVAIESIEVKPELSSINDKLDTLKDMIHDRTWKRKR